MLLRHSFDCTVFVSLSCNWGHLEIWPVLLGALVVSSEERSFHKGTKCTMIATNFPGLPPELGALLQPTRGDYLEYNQMGRGEVLVDNEFYSHRKHIGILYIYICTDIYSIYNHTQIRLYTHISSLVFVLIASDRLVVSVVSVVSLSCFVPEAHEVTRPIEALRPRHCVDDPKSLRSPTVAQHSQLAEHVKTH